MSAHHCFLSYTKQHKINDFYVSSAGTNPHFEGIDANVIKKLAQLGIDASLHVPRKIDEHIIKNNDIIVSMSTDHKEFLKENFNIDSYLFNEIAYNLKTPILDNWEVIKDYKTNKSAFDDYNSQVVEYIYVSMPYFVKNLINMLQNK